jgi:hypothetical protein
MEKKVFLLLILVLLTSPLALADSYIIEPPENNLILSEFNCNPIWGTNSCSAELNKEQLELLKSKGYKIYPNFKVHAFLDASIPQIEADKLWNIIVNGENLTGKGQTICILDTGIDYNHSALGNGWGNKVIAGWRFLDNGADNQNCSSNNTACYDDEGHGTHVAGIISSTNETYKGVAFDSKLVVVKVLDSSGSGWLSDIISGINYCVNNSEKYNISVISMSLGTYATWTSYCDDEIPVLTSAINNATAKNISVIVASGNSGVDGVSLPACIENATPVGSVNNYDSISYFSNTWKLKQIFAPGESITSTCVSNSYCTKSGTSMATPHVAASFALINQYLNLKGQKKTPQELKNLFISTGINIDGNYNHSRIDVYLAYINVSNKKISIYPTNLNFSLEPGSEQTLNLSIDSENKMNISITFSNLTNSNKLIENSNIFAWVDGNLSHNATGNETLVINNTNHTIISIKLSPPLNKSGIYIGEITITLTNGSSSTIIYVDINADILYKNWKKLEFTGCETVDIRAEIGNISSFIIKGNFSNLTSSTIIIKNSTSILANSSKTQVTEDKIQINNPPPGIWEIILGCGSESDSNVSDQSFYLSENSLSASWLIAGSSLELTQEGISLSLTPNNITASSFNLTTNSTEENVTLSIDNYYLVYNWLSKSISNRSYVNFTFIVPYSNNITANLSWTNSTNNLTLSLINLRTGESFSNFIGSTPTIINLNSSQVSYGIWKASIFGENIFGNEKFNLTIKFLDNRFKINFTDIEHKFENKIISNNSAKNWSFYVSNDVSSINISLISNATDDIVLSLYNSTDLSSSNLVNSTNIASGVAYIYTTSITSGYWIVLINNTNSTQTYSYNLTVSLSGNNITKIGNITNESYTIVSFNLGSPTNKLVEGNYNSVIIITATNINQDISLNINLLASILKLKPYWTSYHYIGNQTFLAGENEAYNTTRRFYININQTKNLIFVINNTGSLSLTNLTQINSTNLTNGNLTLDFVTINLAKNISPKKIGYLNLTLEAPENSSYLGTYQGWIYLNSPNAQPFNYFNLTLNVIVTNQTLPRLENNIYYFNNPTIKFKVYYYDNETLDTLFSSSATYNLTLKNLTGAIKNISFTCSSGLFSSQLNTTNLTEGNYSILGSITDLANNEANINLSFELLHNLNLAITIPNNNSIVRDKTFSFQVNVSKLGNVTAKNVTVCLELPDQIENLTNLCNTSVGDINQLNSKLLTWQLKGTSRGTYTINVTAYSSDLRFNSAASQIVEIKYGNLIVSLYSAPSSREVNQSFSVTIKIENNGTWSASNVSAKIEVCGTTKNTDCSNKNIQAGEYITCIASSFTCSSPDIENIYAKLYGVINSTCHGSECGSIYTRKIGEITITSPSTSESEESEGVTAEKAYDISFEEPSSDKFSVGQGEKKTLNVVIKNIGNMKITNGYLEISGINSTLYKITPTEKRDFKSAETLSFDVEFNIPENFEAKDYVITLIFKSDEYKESKKITLEILKTDLSFNLTDIEITQGEKKEIEFYLENIGEITLYNIKVNLSGINTNYFNLSPSQINSLSINKKTYITLTLEIPKSEEMGERNLNLIINSDKKNFSKTIKLTILPCEERKSAINAEYLALKEDFMTLLEQLEAAKKEGKNVTLIEAEIEEINNSLKTLESYLEQGRYIEAKKVIDSLNEKLNSLFTKLQKIEVKKEDYFLLILAILVAIALLSTILIYMFVLPHKPKVLKVYGTPTYTFRKSRFDFMNKFRRIFKKLKYRKSEEEIIRKKKLKEWKRYYEELKKKKYGI